MPINPFATRVASSSVVTASDPNNAAMLVERVLRNAGVELAKEVRTTGGGARILAAVTTVAFKKKYTGYVGFELSKDGITTYVSDFYTVAEICQNIEVSDKETAVKVYKDMKTLKLPKNADLLEFSSVFASFYKDQVAGANAALRAFKDEGDKKIVAGALKPTLATFKALSTAFTRLAKKVKY